MCYNGDKVFSLSVSFPYSLKRTFALRMLPDKELKPTKFYMIKTGTPLYIHLSLLSPSICIHIHDKLSLIPMVGQAYFYFRPFAHAIPFVQNMFFLLLNTLHLSVSVHHSDLSAHMISNLSDETISLVSTLIILIVPITS